MADSSPGMGLRPRKLHHKAINQPLTAAERSQRWRDSLKKNTAMYNAFKDKDASRQRINRKLSSRIMTDEQRERAKAANRARQKKFREKKKLQGLTTTRACPKKKMLTRKETEKQREYWRQKQKDSRQNRTSQKIRRKKEKDRMYVKCKRNPNHNTSGNINTAHLKKQLQWAKFPKNPDTFAETLNYIMKTSPRKRKAMADNGLLRTENDKCNKMVMQVLQEKIKDKKTKKTLLPALRVLKKYRMLKKTSLNLGISLSSLSRATDQPRKSRLDKNLEEQTHIFFQNTSIPVPDTKSVKRKEPEERRILDRSLKCLFTEYKESGGPLAFSTFAKKKPNNVQTCTKQPWYSCLCEYCTNVDLKLKALNESLNKYNKQDCKLTDRYHAVNLTLCDKEEGQQFQRKCCVERECQECGKDQIVRHLAPLLSEHGHEPVVYTVWERQQGVAINGKSKVRVMMVKKKESLNALVIKLADHLDTLAKHLFVARWQQKQFSSLITNVPPQWVVLNLDFAENYSCISQMEIQSAHWAHNQATIHPIVCYYKCDRDNCETTVQETLLFISDDLKHDHHAVNCFVKKTNEHLINVRSIDIVKQIQFCDGCASQYKSCLTFCDISHSMQDFGFITERNYYGSRHGKGPSDGAGAVLKSTARRAVNLQNEVINSAKDLADFAERRLTLDEEAHTHRRRKIFYVTSQEINRNRPERNAKTVPGTRALHCVRTGNVSQSRYVKARHLRCFCSKCSEIGGTDEECENIAYVDEFKEIELRDPLRRQDRTRATGNGRTRDDQRTRLGRTRCENGTARGRGRGRPSTRADGRGRGGPRTRGGGRGRGGSSIAGAGRGRGRSTTRGGRRGRGGSSIRGAGRGRGGPRTRGGRRGGPRSRAADRHDTSDSSNESSSNSFSSSDSESSNSEISSVEDKCPTIPLIGQTRETICVSSVLGHESSEDKSYVSDSENSESGLMDISGLSGLLHDMESDTCVAESGIQVAELGTGVSELGTGVAELWTGLAELVTEEAESGTGVAELGTGVAELWTGLAELVTEEAESGTGVAELGTGVAELGTEVAESRTGVAEMGKEVAESRTCVAEMGTDIAEVGTCVAEMGTEVAESRTGVAEMGKEVAESRTGVAEMVTEAAESRTCVAEMGTDIAEVGTCVAEMGTEVAESRTGVAEMGKEVAESRTGVAEMVTEAAESRTCVAKIGTDVAKLVTETAESRTCVAEMGPDVAELVTGVAELVTEAAESRTCVAEMMTGVAELVTEAAESRTCVAEMGTDVAESRTCVAEMVTGVAELVTEAAESRTCVAEMGTDVAESRTCVAQMVTDVAELVTEAAESRTGVAESGTGVAEVGTCAAELVTEVTESRTGVAEFVTEVTESRTGVAEFVTEVAESRTGVAELVTEVAESRTGVAELVTEVAESRTGVAEFVIEVAESRTGVAELVTEVAESRTGVAEMMTEVAEMMTCVSYQDGTYIHVQHGAEKYPAVVDGWPWVKFFKNKQGHSKLWEMQEIRHQVIVQDVAGVLRPPELACCGSRFLYVFEDC